MFTSQSSSSFVARYRLTGSLAAALAAFGTLTVGAGAALADDPPPLSVSYDKGVAIRDEAGDFLVRLAFKTQIRFETTRPLDDGAETTSRLSVPRARLQLDGNFAGKSNRYKVDAALGDAQSFGHLRDLWVEKSVAESLWVRVGQWKRPFNRQDLVSDFSGEFNERAITSGFAGGGRDMGIAIHNDYEKSPAGLEFAAGVFNGFAGGDDRPVISTDCADDGTGVIECATPAPTGLPGDWSPTLVARVGWNVGKIKAYSEGDLEGGDARLAFGAAYKVDLADLAGSDAMSHGAQVDAMLKLNGFDLQGAFILIKEAGEDAEVGGHVQAGHVVAEEQGLVAVRGAIVTAGDRAQIEARASFSLLWKGHSWKLVTDAGMLMLTGEDAAGESDKPDLQLRSMAQLAF